MVKFHPTESMLHQFVSGELAPALSLVLATHIDMCPVCQQSVRELESELAQSYLSRSGETNSPVLDNASMKTMLDAIVHSEPPAPEKKVVKSELVLDGKEFHLPRPLARQAENIGHWSKLPGNLWKASIDVADEGQLSFIYMAENSTVPEHTHKGHEATVVVNGVFEDEFNTYRDGDFIYLDADRQHTPVTTNEDCLTLAWLDKPLHFTSGIARLLNPFSSLFFR